MGDQEESWGESSGKAVQEGHWQLDLISYLQESTGESCEDYQYLLIEHITSQLQSDKGTGFGFGNTY